MFVNVHMIVSGRVQGVLYRASARDKARKLGVVGWVMNTVNGKVEIIAEGKKENVDLFIDWCRHGPLLAKVEDVRVVEEKEIMGLSFDGFEIRY